MIQKLDPTSNMELLFWLLTDFSSTLVLFLLLSDDLLVDAGLDEEILELYEKSFTK